MTDWISKLPTSTKIHDIILPATHNSGAYTIDFCKLTTLQKFGIYFLRKWTINQSLTIEEQLNMGIRFLDLRISFFDGFYISHTFATITMDNALNQVLSFLEKNPKEFVIIKIVPDFNNRHTVNLENLERTLDDKIGHLLYRSFTTETKIEDLKNQRILIADNLREHWYDKSDADLLYSEYKTTYFNEYQYNLLDLVLTPNKDYIISNLFTGLKKMAKNIGKYNDEILNDIKTNSKSVHAISLDFPDKTFVDKIIGHNGS